MFRTAAFSLTASCLDFSAALICIELSIAATLVVPTVDCSSEVPSWLLKRGTFVGVTNALSYSEVFGIGSHWNVGVSFSTSFVSSFGVLSIAILVSSFFSGVGSGFSSTGGGAVTLFVNSLSPCAKRHLSPYLQLPFSFQFLHISYLSLRITGGAVVATGSFLSSESACFFGSADSEGNEDEVGLPKLDSPKGCLLSMSSAVFCLIWYA